MARCACGLHGQTCSSLEKRRIFRFEYFYADCGFSRGREIHQTQVTRSASVSRVPRADAHLRRGDMYQGIGMATNPGPPAYEPSFLHSSAAASPVYVPTTRVTPMIPALPYLQTHGAAQQNSPGSNHSAWSQSAPEVASYGTASTHHSPVSTRFGFSASPPLTSAVATARENTTYTNPLNISANGRESYAPRALGGSYPGHYPAYVGPNMGGSWPASPFDSSVLHSLTPGTGGNSVRHPNLGKPPVNQLTVTVHRAAWFCSDLQAPSGEGSRPSVLRPCLISQEFSGVVWRLSIEWLINE